MSTTNPITTIKNYNAMVSTEKDFKTLKALYMGLIQKVLILHGVSEVKCENEKEHFFDRIVTNEEGTLSVYKYGLSKPSSGLFFDFTMDYATCLSYIEHDLYLAERNGEPERGMNFMFNR